MQIRHQIVRTIYKHSSIGFNVYTLGFKRVCRSFYQGLVSRVQDLGRLVDFFIRVQCIGLRIQKDLQIFIYLLGLGVQEILVSFKKKKKFIKVQCLGFVLFFSQVQCLGWFVMGFLFFIFYFFITVLKMDRMVQSGTRHQSGPIKSPKSG